MRRWVDLDTLIISINAVFDSKTAKKVCEYLNSYIAVKEEHIWIPVEEQLPTESEYRVVCTAHSGKPFLRRFEVAYITDTTEYQFGYYDGYKWIDKSNKEIPNVVAWKIHEPFNLQN